MKQILQLKNMLKKIENMLRELRGIKEIKAGYWKVGRREKNAESSAA